MKIWVKDNFLPDIDSLNEYSRGLGYEGEVNPVDGVEYPDISADIPNVARDSIQRRLEERLQHPIAINSAFLRLTTKVTGTAPHQAHNDKSMGQYGFILYMQDGPGGTSFVRHKDSGFRRQPSTDEQFEQWQRDMNTPDQWDVWHLVNMKYNRGLLYPADYMHRAEPIGGFGTGNEDGRLVLIMFFDELVT